MASASKQTDTKAAGKGVVTKMVDKNDEFAPIENAPAHLRDVQTTGRGSEGVTTGDIVIPRLEVVQALSKCLKRSEAGFIEGAAPGMLYNNVTRELYGEQVIACPIVFKKEWILWVDRKAKGATQTGGFKGSFDSEAEAIRAKRDLGEDGRNLLVTETHQQYCVLLLPGGRREDVVVSCSRTKIKPSKNWNSLVRLNGGDRFARLYRINAVEDSNDKGDFHNFSISNHGFAPEDVYRRAEAMYELAMKGGLVPDRNHDDSIDGESSSVDNDEGGEM